MLCPVKPNNPKSFEEHFKTIFSEEKRKTYYAIATTMAVMLFFLYFTHINYTPKLSITDSTILVFSAIFIGLGFTLCLLGLFILPTLIWKEFLQGILIEKKKAFCYLLSRQTIPLSGLITLGPCLLLDTDLHQYLVIGLISLILIWVTWLAVNVDALWKNLQAAAINTIVMLVCFAILIYIAKHGVEDIKDPENKNSLATIYLFGGVLAILLFNTFSSSIGTLNIQETLVLGLVLMCVIFGGTQSWAMIPKGVMHQLGLGSFRANQLLISGDLCIFFKDEPSLKILNEKPKLCALDHPWILWSGEEAILIRIKDIKHAIPRSDAKLLSYDVKKI
ncbi:hypothetical protein [Pseudomonas chlororaphis]|uniref:Uncharacterized protein n=1 Tax=Pseudomonas chlororaphis TaxID=587753 RepID=A0A1Q8ELY9_9PSED|nr:hypothetical protein [Pseudomonas chlororaphis]OLF52806.1 hypothetical protein BTN82_22890 [Pseudomonas chlororaphis]